MKAVSFSKSSLVTTVLVCIKSLIIIVFKLYIVINHVINYNTHLFSSNKIVRKKR